MMLDDVGSSVVLYNVAGPPAMASHG
jgi:hypothetical protein